MKIITSNGHNYRTQQFAEAYYIDITINEKQSRVYACLGEKDSNPGTVGMLFVRSSDKADLKQLLLNECDAEETCSRLASDYRSEEIDEKYKGHITTYREYCLFTFSTDPERFKQRIESFKQRMEADNISETLDSSNPDVSIQESLLEVETIDQTSIDDGIEDSTGDKPTYHKKKIGLLAIPCIILLTIPVGYAIIKGSNQQEDNVSSSDTDSAIESITSTTQNADNQISSTIIETSESETIVVTTSSPPNLDLDGNGTIDDDDYRKLVKYNLNPNQERSENIKQIYDVLDYDKDGDIDPDEWDKYISKSD